MKQINIAKENIVKENVEEIKIKSIKKLENKQKVYNLYCKRYHNFLVNGGIVSHNCDGLRYVIYSTTSKTGNNALSGKARGV